MEESGPGADRKAPRKATVKRAAMGFSRTITRRHVTIIQKLLWKWRDSPRSEAYLMHITLTLREETQTRRVASEGATM